MRSDEGLEDAIMPPYRRRHDNLELAHPPGRPTSAAINVTPLVDVCLVLLILFMVVTPIMHGDAGVDLPATKRPQPLPEPENQLTISIQRDGGLRLGQDWVSKANLPPALRRAWLRHPDKKVVIKADRRIAYRAVLGVMRDLAETGFRRAGLAATRLPAR
jgi:biopolymer transport protein ExbD